jgi:hypothetical protein
LKNALAHYNAGAVAVKLWLWLQNALTIVTFVASIEVAATQHRSRVAVVTFLAYSCGGLLVS